MLAKNQGPGQQKGGEEGKDFSQTKPGQPAQAAEQVEPHKDQQLNRNVFFSKLAAVESQGQKWGHHRGQGAQKGHGGGGGELQGDVVGHIGAPHAEAGKQPVPGGADLQSPPDSPAEHQQQKGQGNAVAGGQQGIDGENLIGGLGNGVPQPIQYTLQKDKQERKPAQGGALPQGEPGDRGGLV